MPDKDASTPRVFLYRHGETEWSRSGRYTGTTDLDLTDDGERQVLASGRLLVGPGKLIDPLRLARVFVSPRLRAIRTFELAFGEAQKKAFEDAGKAITTPKLAEWDYGLYEGLVTKEIRALRQGHGLDQERSWDIWRDGCESGESPQEVTERLDSLIREIRVLQKDNMYGEQPSDIVLIAHGHLLRAFVKRWLEYSMDFSMSTMLEPGAVGCLSYQHHSIEEPALLVGLGFPPSQAE